LMIHAGEIILSPKCKILATHLKYGIWKKNRKDFERSGEFGHFDAIDALVYLGRTVNTHRNPYPKEEFSSDTHFVRRDLSGRNGLFGMQRAINDALSGGVRNFIRGR